jgi:hypothetical protein
VAARGAGAAADAGDRSGLVIAWAKAVEIGYYPRMIDALYSLSGFGVGLLVGMTGVGGGSPLRLWLRAWVNHYGAMRAALKALRSRAVAMAVILCRRIGI